MKFCECGCGRPTNYAKVDDPRKGHIKGKPVRFISGHQGRKRVRYIIDPLTGCWNWQLSETKAGYPMLYFRKGKQKSMCAHRWYYIQKYGEIPEGLQLDHLCRNRGCVNPDHLEPVTPAENTRRGAATKLKMSDVDFIREAHKNGTSVTELARQFGVAGPVVSNIVNGKRWLGRLTLRFAESMGMGDTMAVREGRSKRKGW